LHSGLDLLVRSGRGLTPHALPVHLNSGLAHVENDPELLNVSSGHEAILGGVGDLAYRTRRTTDTHAAHSPTLNRSPDELGDLR
jgi:hypothetical protein